MKYEKKLRLVTREVLEANLALELGHGARTSDELQAQVPTASGLAVVSASGLAVVSASGLAVVSASGLAVV